MNLIGRTLGNYQIVTEIGRGGMGVVYRAYQPSLGRYVALKVLPPQLAFNTAFVQRFQQEARSAARLHHPNIVVIHDVGEQEGFYYIAMQEVEGEPLSQLISRQDRLPLARAAHIVSQLAAALDHAHDHGVIHRDIKPSNIIVGSDDAATLTDFGIAKAAEATGLTATGAALGTPEYMSPEQAQGTAVGAATDIYSLGLVAYHMLAGRVPFSAASTPAILYKQVHEQPPPVVVHAPDLPPEVDAALNKALAKEPAQRYRQAGQLAAALQTMVQGKASAGRPATLPPGRTPAPPPAQPQAVLSRSRLPAVAIAVLAVMVVILLAGAAIGLMSQNDQEERAQAEPTGVPVVITAATTPEEVPTTATLAPATEESPSTPLPDIPQVVARQAVNVYAGPGTDYPQAGQASQGQTLDVLAGSADSLWWRACCVAGNPVWVEAALVSLQGNADRVPVVEAPPPAPIPDPTPEAPATATATPASTATPTPVADGGTAVVANQSVNLRSGPGTGFPVTGQLQRGDTLPILGRNADGSWWQVDATGSGGADGAPAWVIARLVDTQGNVNAVAVATDIPELPTATPAAAPAALRGRLVFTRNAEGGRDGANEIYTYDLATGATTRLTSNGDNDWIPRWSPDGRQIAFTSNRQNSDRSNYDIWVMNADGGSPQRKVGTSAWDEYAAWSPVSSGVIALSTTGMTDGLANSEIHVGSNTGDLRRVTFNSSQDEWPSWSPDGQRLAHSSNPAGSRDIYIATVSTGQSERLYGTGADENQIAWSPDGRWIAFISRGQSRDAYGHLMLVAPDGSGATTLTGSFAGNPAWAPDSQWIVFTRGVDTNGSGGLDERDESDLWAIRLSDRLLTPLVEAPGNDFSPSWTY